MCLYRHRKQHGRRQRLIAEESKRAAAEDGIDAVILGCVGMVQVIDDVAQRFPSR